MLLIYLFYRRKNIGFLVDILFSV